jgi:hypothetical protein
MNSPIELRQKLIDSVDEKYHVKDMGAIVDVLSTLERLAVTKEVLESTRLGKTVNEFRRKVNNEYLAKRAKNLVKRWRDLVLEQDGQGSRPHNGSGGGPTSFNASLLLVGPTPSLLSSKVSPSSSLLSSKVSPSSSLVSSKVSPCGSPQNSNSSCSFPISNNNPGGSNGSTSLTNVALRNVQQNYGATSSPTSISTSLYVGSSTTNKKSPFIGFRNNSNTSPLPQSTSYAPNVEVTSKTNSANKRYREEPDVSVVLNECESPKAKKARKLVNGSGALDDPLLTFDEISKDSVNSRLSDLSDGSSKLLSHPASSIPYCSATSAMLVNQESANFSPPLAASSLSSLGEPMSVTSLDNHPSPSASYSNSKPVSPDKPKKKRKKRNEDDGIFDTELREKILKAKAEKKDLFRKDEVYDKLSSQEGNLELRRIQSAALSPISVKNEIVESYLNSQNQLKAQMQRHAESVEPSVATNDANDNFGKEKNKLLKGKVKSSKSKSKKKTVVETKVSEAGTEAEQRFETEAEILSRLPPLDPAILAEVKDFHFYYDPDPKEDHNSNQNENETDTIVHVTKETNKFDWGDSDEEEPVAAKLSETSMSVQQVKTENVREDPATRSGILSFGSNDNPEVPLREVEESEVDRLHLEQISNLNGNEDKDGNFREWHEILTVDSFKEDALHILPYTVIDF